MVINRGRTPLFLRIVHLFANAAGKARQIRRHDQGDRKRFAPIAADTREPGDLPSVPGIMPNLGALPAASTEVVLAEGMNSALRCVVRASLSSLIPVLVTGIQPPRVCAVNDSIDD